MDKYVFKCIKSFDGEKFGFSGKFRKNDYVSDEFRPTRTLDKCEIYYINEIIFDEHDWKHVKQFLKKIPVKLSEKE